MMEKDKLLTISEVCLATGYSAKKIGVFIKQRIGGFPFPVKDTEGNIVWWESEVNEYIKNKNTLA